MGELYHLCNRSIGEAEIFSDKDEYERFRGAVRFYQINQPHISFSNFISTQANRPGWVDWQRFDENGKIVKIIAYCIMPTHFHIALSQTKEKGAEIFVNNLLNSYTRYYNIKHGRKGPLWQGPTKKVLVENDAQLLHLTRYINLNPVTAYLVNKPEDWSASSYNEYLLRASEADKICDCYRFLDMTPENYKKFVENGIEYQRELAKIKKLSIISPTDPVNRPG
jgi:putative transposase